MPASGGGSEVVQAIDSFDHAHHLYPLAHLAEHYQVGILTFDRSPLRPFGIGVHCEEIGVEGLRSEAFNDIVM
jgi:hypothetical protein